MVINQILKVVVNYLILSGSSSSNGFGIKDLLPLVSLIPSLFSVFVATFAVYIAMRNTNITIRIARLNNIVETVSLFLMEVDPNKNDWAELAEKSYVSDQHNFLENKIIMLLNDKEQDEQNLIATIKRFKDEIVDSKMFNELRNQTIVLTRKITAKAQV